ncbi:MAG: CBS domain-containing protein [Acidobacteriia bacterium]|nr:CBS domain-containing protein [Terriglobia bacterium]
MLVRDYMTTQVSSLRDDLHLLEAALLIRRSGKRHVPVIDAEGTVVGIVTDRDVAQMAPSLLGHITPEEYNAVFEMTPITRAMTANPITVTPQTTMREVVSLLYTKKIGALPVVESGKLVGIVTRSDALALLNELLAEAESSSGAAV